MTAMIVTKLREIESRGIFTLKLPHDSLDMGGVGKLVANVLYPTLLKLLPNDMSDGRWLDPELKDAPFRINRIRDKLFEDVGPEWCNKRGLWTKRFARWVKQTYHVTLDPGVMGRVGDIVRKTFESEDIVCDVTRDLRWAAGDFGDSGSCYWGCYANARDMLEHHGCFAFRWYKPGNRGWARCWVVPLILAESNPRDDAVALFNAYPDSVSLIRMARVLSVVLDAPYYRTCNLDCRGSDLYINGVSQYTVGYTNSLPDTVKLDIRNGFTCNSCGAYVEGDYNGDATSPICSDCDGSVECAQCGERIENGSAVTLGDETYCSACADERFECSNCGGATLKSELCLFWDKLLCERCHKKLVGKIKENHDEQDSQASQALFA